MKISQAAPKSLSVRYIQGAATKRACTPKPPATPQTAVPRAIPAMADNPARRDRVTATRTVMMKFGPGEIAARAHKAATESSTPRSCIVLPTRLRAR